MAVGLITFPRDAIGSLKYGLKLNFVVELSRICWHVPSCSLISAGPCFKLGTLRRIGQFMTSLVTAEDFLRNAEAE